MIEGDQFVEMLDPVHASERASLRVLLRILDAPEGAIVFPAIAVDRIEEMLATNKIYRLVD